MANVVFGGEDLSALGLKVNRISGWLGMVGVDQQDAPIAGRQVIDKVDLRRTSRQITLGCNMYQAARATFLTNLASLKTALSPSLGYQEITRADITGRRYLARCLGFPLDEDLLPFIIRGGEFDVLFDCLFPWQEDSNLTGVADVGASLTVGGDTSTEPLWTCTCLAALGSGLWFEVAGERFTYSGALAEDDVLTVYTDLPDVELNGTRSIADVATTAKFPKLAPGANAVTKSSTDFTLAATYRCRYE